MADFSFRIDEELSRQFADHLKAVEEAAPKMLEEAAPLVVKSLQHYAPVSTGKMKKGIKARKPKKAKNGAWILPIVFTGKEKRKNKSGDITVVSNALKAKIAEYGRSGLSPEPFIRPAMEDIEEEVNTQMAAIFYREVMK